MMENFIASQQQTNKDFLNQNIHNSEQLKQLSNKVDALATHNKMLETQISQVAQQQAPTAAPAGTFPAQPQPNPKGHANAITLRSGMNYDGPIDPRTQNALMSQQEPNEIQKTLTDAQTSKTNENNNKVEPEKEKSYVPPPPYKPPIPYPQRLAKSKTEA